MKRKNNSNPFIKRALKKKGISVKRITHESLGRTWEVKTAEGISYIPTLAKVAKKYLKGE